MRRKLKNAWKNRNNIAMGFLMIITIYAAFVVNNLQSRRQGGQDENVE